MEIAFSSSYARRDYVSCQFGQNDGMSTRLYVEISTNAAELGTGWGGVGRVNYTLKIEKNYLSRIAERFGPVVSLLFLNPEKCKVVECLTQTHDNDEGSSPETKWVPAEEERWLERLHGMKAAAPRFDFRTKMLLNKVLKLYKKAIASQ
jgi:hypothetical protein